jgi:ABC-type sugar transport system ATPase subunit
MTDARMPPYAVEMLGITKRFGTVLANDGIDLQIPAGSIHGWSARTAPASPP